MKTIPLPVDIISYMILMFSKTAFSASIDNKCTYPLLGNENAFPAASVLTATSSTKPHVASNGVIVASSSSGYDAAAWCALATDAAPSLTVNFDRLVLVKLIQIQGYNGSYVTSYFAQYDEGGSEVFYSDPPGSLKFFTGNTDDSGIHETPLNRPILSTRIKLKIIASVGSPKCARIQLLGCLPELLQCPEGTVLHDGICYQVIEDPSSWTDARERCRSGGGDLALILNQKQQDFVKSVTKTAQTWIGLNALEGDKFRWLDYYNSPVTYTKWVHGSRLDPPLYSRDLDCVGVVDLITQPKWQDQDCQRHLPYICEFKYGTDSSTCTGEGTIHDASCYIFHDTAADWLNASQSCVAEGDTLVQINNAADNLFIYELLKNKSAGDAGAWIGLNDRKKEGDMKWLTEGAEVAATFTDFKGGTQHQTAFEQRCVVVLGQNGTWQAQPCNRTIPYTCQKYADACRRIELRPGETLQASERLCWRFGRFEVKFSTAGVLSMFDHMTNTTKAIGGQDIAGDAVKFYANGSLVIMKGTSVVWTSGTSGVMSHVNISSSGILTMYSVWGNIIWEDRRKDSCHIMPVLRGRNVYTASSSSTDTSPDHARLDFPEITNTQVGAWCADKIDDNPWIQIDFKENIVINGITTQARNSPNAPGYVKDYTIQTSLDATDWIDYKVDNTVMIFRGNEKAGDDKVENILPIVVVARYIRLRPKIDKQVPTCLRLGVNSCTENMAYAKDAKSSYNKDVLVKDVTDGELHLAGASCCQKMKQPWIMVDLGAFYLVRDIVISTAGVAISSVSTSVMDIAWDFSVSSLKPCHVGTIDISPNTSETVRCQPPIHGRYVIVYSVLQNASLPVVEVEVYTRQAGWPSPDWESDWRPLQNYITKLTHNLHTIPVMAQILAKADANLNAGFVFDLSQFDDVTLAADHVHITMMGFGGRRQFCVGTTNNTQSFGECSSSLSIKVKVWTSCNLTPSFVSDKISLTTILSNSLPLYIPHFLGGKPFKITLSTILQYNVTYAVHIVGSSSDFLRVGTNITHIELDMSCTILENTLKKIQMVLGQIPKENISFQLTAWEHISAESITKTYKVFSVGPEVIPVPHFNNLNYFVDMKVIPRFSNDSSRMQYDIAQYRPIVGGIIYGYSNAAIRLWWAMPSNGYFQNEFNDCNGVKPNQTADYITVRVKITRIGRKITGNSCSVPTIVHGKVISQEQVVCTNTSVDVECDEGYSLSNLTKTQVECIRHNTWSTEIQCKPLPCDTLTIANSNVSKLNGIYGDTVSVKCSTGYAYNGSVQFQTFCMKNGTWSLTPDCTLVDCHKIPEVESAQITKWPPSNISSLDAEATYACRYGFSTMIGNPTIRCLINNSWTSPPSCKKDCDHIPVSTALLKSTNETHSSTTVLFRCEENHVLAGAEQVTCSDDGLWSPDVPTCVNVTHLNAVIENNKCILRSCDSIDNITWTQWSSCSSTCDKGVERRQVTCTVELTNGVHCQQTSYVSRFCYQDPCPFERLRVIELQPAFKESDHRASAIALGSAAIGILIGYMALFFALDSGHILNDLQRMVANLRGLWRHNSVSVTVNREAQTAQNLNDFSLDTA